MQPLTRFWTAYKNAAGVMLPLSARSFHSRCRRKTSPPNTTSGSSHSPFLNETTQRGPSFGLFFFSSIFLLWKMSSIHKSGIMNGHCSAKVDIPGDMLWVCSGRILQHRRGGCKAAGRQTSGPQVLVPQVPGKPWFPFCKQQVASFGF